MKSEFLNELCDLLDKYDVEISASDHWEGYAECGQDIKITIEFNADYSEIEMGSLLCVDTIVKELDRIKASS